MQNMIEGSKRSKLERNHTVNIFHYSFLSVTAIWGQLNDLQTLGNVHAKHDRGFETFAKSRSRFKIEIPSKNDYRLFDKSHFFFKSLFIVRKILKLKFF
jgi:hypothetical protein